MGKESISARNGAGLIVNTVKKMAAAANLETLVEWGDFAPRHLVSANGKCPTRRVGKRLIAEKEIPGRILDGRPWVYELQYLLGQQSDQQADATSAALELLGM